MARGTQFFYLSFSQFSNRISKVALCGSWLKRASEHLQPVSCVARALTSGDQEQQLLRMSYSPHASTAHWHRSLHPSSFCTKGLVESSSSCP